MINKHHHNMGFTSFTLNLDIQIIKRIVYHDDLQKKIIGPLIAVDHQPASQPFGPHQHTPQIDNIDPVQSCRRGIGAIWPNIRLRVIFGCPENIRLVFLYKLGVCLRHRLSRSSVAIRPSRRSASHLMLDKRN